VTGAVISLATMISFYRYAVARLHESGPDPSAPGAQPVSSAVG
jgi:hypothetical protein